MFVCLLANLCSKQNVTREESIDSCKRLAKQCTDSTAIEALLKQTFAVFHGSEGKLTVVEHKISVLQVGTYTKLDLVYLAWLLLILGCR